MKNLILIGALFFSITSQQSIAASSWANCPGFSTTAIQEVFWKSDIDGGSGPDYHLPSGQTLSNAGSVCQPGSALKTEEWERLLKTNLNPVKAVKSFTSIKSTEEFQKFLKEFGVTIVDLDKLNEAVKVYLSGKSIVSSESEASKLILNPTILVGKSHQQALIALVTSDGKTRSATFLALKNKTIEP